MNEEREERAAEDLSCSLYNHKWKLWWGRENLLELLDVGTRFQYFPPRVAIETRTYH